MSLQQPGLCWLHPIQPEDPARPTICVASLSYTISSEIGPPHVAAVLKLSLAKRHDRNRSSFLYLVELLWRQQALAPSPSFVARDKSLITPWVVPRSPRDPSPRSPLPRLTSLPQPSAPSLARSIVAPVPGLVRLDLRRPRSTDRSLLGA